MSSQEEFVLVQSRPIKPLAGATRWLCRLLKLQVAVSAAAAIAAGYQAYAYTHSAPGVDLTKGELPADLPAGLVAGLDGAVHIVLGILFLRWIYRLSANLHKLSNGSMRFGRAGSIGWYFVPIASLYKPYQAMCELWTTAHCEQNENDSVLRRWWAWWLTSNFLANASFRLQMHDTSNDAALLGVVVDLFSSVAEIALCGVAVELVARLGDAYHRNFAQGRES